MAERQYLHAGADLDPTRARSNRAGDGQWRGQYRAAGLLVNFSEPDRVEPPAIGGLDLR